MGVNMRSINIRAAENGIFEGKLEVMVTDLVTLESLINRLQEQHEYIKVQRLDKPLTD